MKNVAHTLWHRRTFIFGAAVGIGAVCFDPVLAATGSFICRAFIDRTTLQRGSKFELTALIEWISGDGRIFMPLTWGLRGFQVSIADARGTTSTPPINDFHPPPPQAVNDSNRFIHMFEGMVIGQKINSNVSDFFPEPGRHTIFVGYLSPVPRAYTSVENAVVTEDSVVNASPIAITVT